MITVTLLLGKDTVSIYKKTGIIPPEENTADSGGYMITRQFGLKWNIEPTQWLWKTWKDIGTGRCWLPSQVRHHHSAPRISYA